MLCVEDYPAALAWSRNLGGYEALVKKADENTATIAKWVEKTDWIDFLAESPETRSNTSVCLKITDPAFTALEKSEQLDICKSLSGP